MKDQINRKNYEAFYLDYLEGNLDEDATLVLFAFLADNPELQVEDLGPELMDSTFVLDSDFKNNLKQEASSLVVTSDNIEYFLTAEKENQLSLSKLAELDIFIASNPRYQLDRKIYAFSTLVADKTEIFNDKKALKQRETIVLWPYLSFLAAACAVIVIWLVPNSAFNSEIQSAANVPTTHVKGKTAKTPSENSVEIKNGNKTKDITPVLAVQNIISPKSISGNLSFKKVQKFEALLIENVDLKRSLQEKNPDAIAYRQTEITESPATTLAMTNPVKPLTNKLSDIIKTQVDYKTGKNVESQRKGFSLKIGKFEISQNKKVKTKQ